jgi:hypothetical protein
MLPKTISLLLTASLGITLAISDYCYADIYKEYAFKIKAMLPENAHVWIVGHWGFEWYATQAGMKLYDNEKSILQDGDYVVRAEYVHQQQIPVQEEARLKTIRRIEVAAPAATWLRTTFTDQWGGYYSYGYPYILPWRFSNAPYVFTVMEVITP